MPLTNIAANTAAANTPTTGATSLSATFPQAPAAGNLLICQISVNMTTNPSVSTPAGWTLIPTNGDSNAGSANARDLLYYKQADGTESVVSTTFSANSSVRMVLAEFSNGTPSIWTLDQSTKNQSASGSGTASSGTTAATTVADEVVVGALSKKNSEALSAITAGYTVLDNAGSGASTGANTATSCLVYRVVSATGTQAVSATCGGSRPWVGHIATFSAVASGVTYNDAPSGGLALGGSVAQAKVYDNAPSGGIVLGGACASDIGRSISSAPSGGIVLGGTCTSSTAKGYTDAPSGGIVLGGSVAQTKLYTSTVSAGIVLGGSAISTQAVPLARSGGLVLGGTCVSTLSTAGSYNVTPSGGIVLGGSITLAVLTWSYPVADLLDGNWTDQVGGHNLFAAIDEIDPDDADYIVSSANPSPADICQVRLSGIADPLSSTGHTVAYRYGSDTDAFVTVMQTLSGAQADAITNYTNLSIKFEAVS